MKLGRKKLRKKPVILKSMPALNFHRLLPIICLQKRISNIHTKTVFLHFLTVVFFYKPQQLIVHNSDAIASFCCVAAPCCSSKGHGVAPGRCGWRDAFFWPKSRKMEAGARKSRHTSSKYSHENGTVNRSCRSLVWRDFLAPASIFLRF